MQNGIGAPSDGADPAKATADPDGAGPERTDPVLGRDGRGAALNSATAGELANLGLSPAQVRRILESRPLSSWAHLQGLEGFDAEVVKNLEATGARIDVAS